MLQGRNGRQIKGRRKERKDGRKERGRKDSKRGEELLTESQVVLTLEQLKGYT